MKQAQESRKEAMATRDVRHVTNPWQHVRYVTAHGGESNKAQSKHKAQERRRCSETRFINVTSSDTQAAGELLECSIRCLTNVTETKTHDTSP